MRRPAVAGKFYPADPERLRRQVEEGFLHPLGPGELPKGTGREREVVGAVVPHAGYIYSGPEAAAVYHELAKERKPKTMVIMGPNHTGHGSAMAVSKETWWTPLGEVPVDLEGADMLLDSCPVLSHDEAAHRYEHSIEVQLPFLQYIYGEFQFIPISFGTQDLESCMEVASALAVLKDALILASSDFTHYESQEAAARKDGEAIKHLLAFDEEGFMRAVYGQGFTICGHGPIATCLAASKRLGARRAELLKYGTSGEILGDFTQVVAYAGMVFKK